ncbi:MAG TPA: hypothetical protein VID76_10090, partial [Solirubrobacterales bacterium]
MSRPDPVAPPTLGEEIISAEAPAVASTKTDEQRLALIEKELRTGFEVLADIGPAVCVFGSARTRGD